MEYLILEGNLERLEKKLTAIKNKCNKNNVHFEYTKLGEEIREFKNPATDEVTYFKYIRINVEGSFKYDNWEFAATVEHHDEGNIIRSFLTELEIPERYRTCRPECEHCKKIRSRKDTYIVHNTSTNEFKQVGNTCLKDFTSGLSAEDAAQYISLFDTVIKGEAPYTSGNYERYFDLVDVVAYSFECVKHFGYESYENSRRTTRERVFDYMAVNGLIYGRLSDKEKKQCRKEMEAVSFNPDSSRSKAEEAIAWIRNETNNSNQYIHNLHIACADKYVAGRDSGLAVSLSVAYSRHLEEEIRKNAYQLQREKDLTSTYAGNVGDKVEFEVSSIEIVWSGSNIYGTTYMYKIADTNNNIYMWTTDNGSWLDDRYVVKSIKGTIKKLEEYKGIKQTWLTRCRVTREEVAKPETANDSTGESVEEVVESFLEYCNS